MLVTVRDMAAAPELRGLKMIAGASGLDNVVSGCGILDYEYDRNLKEKYFYRNFKKGEFVLSSFLYAKDNEFFILEAIKRLRQQGCSGLAIRNVFKLNIRENVIRFADAEGFPVFLLTEPDLYFEKIIYLVIDRVEKYSSVFREARIADQIRFSGLNAGNLKKMALEINPSFHEEIVGAFIEPPGGLSSHDYLALSTQARLAPPPNHWDAMFYYKNGLMMLRTGDPYWPGDVRQDLEKWVKAVKAELDPRPRVGFSAVHYSLAELKDVLDESLYSSQLPVENADGHSFYSEAGVFQVFMRLVEDEKAIEFSENCLRGIRAYDNENNTNLMLTASRFILCEGDLKSTATALSQHVNTIRYRLESVGRLLGENILAKKGYELLSTAVKINICKNISDRFA